MYLILCKHITYVQYAMYNMCVIYTYVYNIYVYVYDCVLLYVYVYECMASVFIAFCSCSLWHC